jgi:hypothetical protein
MWRSGRGTVRYHIQYGRVRDIVPCAPGLERSSLGRALGMRVSSGMTQIVTMAAGLMRTAESSCAPRHGCGLQRCDGVTAVFSAQRRCIGVIAGTVSSLYRSSCHYVVNTPQRRQSI